MNPDPPPHSDIASWQWKIGRVSLVVGGLYTIYQITNRWQWRTPTLLSLTSWDRMIPLLEWTIWPYLLLAGCSILPFFLRSRTVISQTLWALMCGYSINLLTFALFPTAYPRIAAIPGVGWQHEAFAWLFSVDSPANCFPSGHITGPMIGFWALAVENFRWHRIIWMVFFLLCPTILTTKQHYVVDLFGGVATGLIGIWIGPRLAGALGRQAATSGRTIPHSGGLLDIKNALAFRRDPLAFFDRIMRQQGLVVSCPLAWFQRYLVAEPGLARAVLTMPHRSANKRTRSVRQMARVAGAGLLTANGERWLRLRRMIQPAFHHQHAAGWAEDMTTLARATIKHWSAERSQPLDIGIEMRRLTFRFIGRVLLGADPSARLAELEGAIEFVLADLWKTIESAVDPGSFLPGKRKRKFDASLAIIDTFVRKSIARRRASGEDGKDFLGVLLSARDPATGAGLTDTELRNECVTFLIAGHDTTANALAWALHLLDMHPPVALALKNEIAGTLHGDEPSTDAILALKWPRAIFLEALRLYPPIWLIERNLEKPLSHDGWHLPAGAQVLVSPWVMHRRSEFWERPDDFWPERFFAPDAEENLAFLPFGAGPRTCIGKPLALLEGRIFLALIARAGHLHHTSAAPVIPEARISLRPVGNLLMRWEPGGSDAPV